MLDFVGVIFQPARVAVCGFSFVCMCVGEDATTQVLLSSTVLHCQVF